MRVATLLGLVLALATPACVIDSVPTPELVPSGPTGATGATGASAVPFLASQVFYSTDGGGPIALVAAGPGTVPAGGYVGAENPATNAWFQRPVASDGSFWLVVSAELGDVLRLVYFHTSTVTLAEMYLTIAPAPSLALAASSQVAMGAAASLPTVSASAPDAQGIVTVAGNAGVVPAGVTVVLASGAGRVVSADSRPDGSFALIVRAQSGEALTLFVADATQSHAGGPLTTLLVP